MAGQNKSVPRKPVNRPVHRCRRGHVMDYVTPKGRYMCRICNRARGRKKSKLRTRARLDARRRRIAQRTRPPLRDRAWAAGHFEGEGTITITTGGRRAYTCPRVILSSTDRSMIDFLQARWPGTLRRYVPRGKEHKVKLAHIWTLQSCDACEGFLLDILPHLVSARVRTKAELLIEEIRDRVRFDRSPERKDRLRERVARIRRLNMRGVGSFAG